MNIHRNIVRRIETYCEMLFVLIFLSCCIFAGMWGCNHMKVESLYAFSRDLAEYVAANKKLPENFTVFCEWKVDENNRPIWDIDNITKIVKLNTMSLEEMLQGNKPIIIIKDEKYSNLTYSINCHFGGHLYHELHKSGEESTFSTNIPHDVDILIKDKCPVSR